MTADLKSTIKALQSQDSQQGIHSVVLSVIQRYGFDCFMMSGLPGRGVEAEPFVLHSGWDPEWRSRYDHLGYAKIDPVARHCFNTTRPFDWSSAPYDGAADIEGRRVREEARLFGMGEGISIPIHLDGSLQCVLSVAGRTDMLGEKQRLELQMLAFYAHGRLCLLSAPPKQCVQQLITPREAEVLKWVAEGKTASEIAEITGLSPRTVNQHCENAQHRLGTNNRIHTVVEAIRNGLITV